MTDTNQIWLRSATIELDLVGRWDVWERMLKKIDSTADEFSCWLWTGWKSGDGYGRVKVDGKACTAHRVAYAILIGPLSTQRVLDHDSEICGNRNCINPLHMNVVTQRDNIKRGKTVLYD